MADDNDPAPRPRVSRRRLLEVSGSSVFLAGTAAGQARSGERQYQSLGNAAFVEVGLEYRRADGREFESTDIAHSDDFRHYSIDEEENQLRLTRAAPERARRRVADEDVMARGQRFRSLPGAVADTISDRSLPISLGANMRPSKALQAESPVPHPAVEVEIRGRRGVRASAEGRGREVYPGREWKSELEERRVSVSRPTESFRETPGRRGGTHRARIYEITDISVVPSVSVQNHGELEVVQPTGGDS